MIKKSSIKQKLLLSFILAITVPALVTLIIIYQQPLSKMNVLADTTLNKSIATVDYFLEKKAEEVLAIAKKYGRNEVLKQAFL